MGQPFKPHLHNRGIHRREILQAGFMGLLGMGLPDLLSPKSAQAAAGKTIGEPRAKSVILVFMTGAPSHQDIWDLKPNSPAEYRGESKPRKTNVAGIEISEHLPLLAGCADKYAIVRSMTHGNNSHEFGTHFVLSGIDKLPPGATFYATRNDWPSMGSVVTFARPSANGLPSAVELPTYLNNGYGFSGQSGGLMGSRYDPWLITSDPSKADFRVPDLTRAPGITADRLGNRKHLLEAVDAGRRDLAAHAEAQALSTAQEKAFDTLTSAQTQAAFDLSQEPDKVRDRYGRHQFGQSLLLSRRLVEAGVRMVQANMGSMNNWDTHTDIFKQLRERLLPPFDKGFSALLEDLAERGMLEDTLVIAVGEFGRTPLVGQNTGGQATFPTGRDHWGGVFSAVFAGGGVQGGRIVGQSDAEAAYPDGDGYYPSDLAATVYTALGIDPALEIHDIQGRPLRVNSGKVIGPLF